MKRIAWLVITIFALAFISFLAPDAKAQPVYTPENDPRPAQANMQGRGPDRLPPGQRKKLPEEFPGTGDTGYFLSQSTGITGIRGYFSVQLSIALNQGNPPRHIYHYTPTTQAPNSCLEIVLAHYRYSTENFTRHILGLWDHCGPQTGGDGTTGWQNVYDMNDTTWRSKYVLQTAFAGIAHPTASIPDKAIYARAYQESWGTGANNCWVVDVWNWQLYQYDRASRACGTPSSIVAGHGWTAYETYGYDTPIAPACPTLGFYNLAEARALDVQRNHSTGLWDFLVASDVESSLAANQCVASGSNHFIHNSTYRDWMICGPGNTNCQ
jgi:hypothetical protein